MSYPAYVNGEPPVVTLKEYDVAPWAGTTCVDRRGNTFVIVVMEKPEQVVATVDAGDNDTLNTIFKSAHKDFSDQLVENKGNVPRKSN
ncbi:CIC11C00000003088 [Sungouiella intermedia]|uniref:CIC11C00000000759 n=1 Tax=Sungouiella intermedia TaxID=45354 RepID=A0A1L0C3B1_9ASCO|nr:CIC11C00000003088 [[Candida] intermedia]SGZ58997.1 CIC11C00000000759 [[Candida] intermedia]